MSQRKKYTENAYFISLIENKIPFTYMLRGVTLFIKPDKGFGHEKKILLENTVKRSELFFIKKVQSSIKQIDKSAVSLRGSIKYRDINKSYSGSIEVCELDLTEAYFNAAIKLGFIDQSIQDLAKEKNISKHTKRVALGSLASVTETWRFNGVRKIFIGEEKKETDYIFFQIANEISSLMQEVMPLCVFYYTDAVFCEKKYAQKVAEIIEGFGYNPKNEGTFMCEINGDNVVVYDESGVSSKTEKRADKRNPLIREFFFGGESKRIDTFRQREAANDGHKTALAALNIIAKLSKQ